MAPELEPPGRCSGTRFRGPTLRGSGDYATNGAAEGIRTPDPRITNALLYQLSYRGMLKAAVLVIPRNCKRKASATGADGPR
jgi:hypothetical protein